MVCKLDSMSWKFTLRDLLNEESERKSGFRAHWSDDCMHL